ncbi:efflux RND transporter periplasmic adaptor subunit [Paracoccus sp. M683]|uniref:efflux RND transporter periplasmic adaptor subunit n=1 Tax=Paracoccus sp. M683 TaxID=2594268 RepID=UPI00117CDE36|nr:efflux RND transporter periplasmic adaptor subunit [Paracoccus sp. M683]TRW97578.1 efflux RND transporter periplasmic adaptor subunit [Paracoccus sp. M683]
MKRLFVILAALTLVPPGPAALAEESAAATVPAAATTIPSVTVADAAMAEVQSRVLLSGTLVARQEVLIFPQVSGYEITELLTETGEQVEKGQVLARMSRDILAAQLAQADAEYQRAMAGVGQAQSQIANAEAARIQAVTALNRVQQLRSSGSAAQATLDDAIAAEASAQAQAASAADGLAVAQAAVAQAEAARALARLNLDRTDIRAPADGLIVERQAELGAIAGSGGEPLFRLIAGGEIELSAEVIETALHQLKLGDPALIQVAGVGAVQGKVRLLPASVDPVTRLGKMRISLDPHPALRTGLFANGSVITAQRQAVTVPAGAVLADDQGEWVQLVSDDGVVQRQQVQAGLLWQSLREIRTGVQPGQRVIARSGAFFRDGDRVSPVAGADSGGGTAP